MFPRFVKNGRESYPSGYGNYGSYASYFRTDVKKQGTSLSGYIYFSTTVCRTYNDVICTTLRSDNLADKGKTSVC